MKKTLLVFIAVWFIVNTSCRKRLDSFLFNPQTLTEYQLDNYTGEVTLDLQGDYGVSPSDIHQFQLPITSAGEELSISAIYTGNLATIDQDTIVLYCHGNKHHMDFYWPRQKLYSHLSNGNYGVLMFDYPGYGMSTGTPTEQNMYDATRGALAWLKSQGVQSNKLVLIGFSLGTAAACEVVSNVNDFPLQPSKLILEAPFASSEVMVQDAALLALPGSFFVDAQINNAEKIKSCAVPLLWVHGREDGFLDFTTHGQLVFDNHPGAKTAFSVDGGDHENTPFVAGYANYLENIKAFIQH